VKHIGEITVIFAALCKYLCDTEFFPTDRQLNSLASGGALEGGGHAELHLVAPRLEVQLLQLNTRHGGQIQSGDSGSGSSILD
jgi:hypothetical protein